MLVNHSKGGKVTGSEPDIKVILPKPRSVQKPNFMGNRSFDIAQIRGRKMDVRRLLTLATILLACGCVTPKAHEDSLGNIDFSKYKTVAYKVHDLPSTEYGGDKSYGTGVIDIFDTLLGKKLASMGFQVVQPGAAADLSLDVAVKAAKPGSGAARVWVGFGAGRAITTFDAVFSDSTRKIASFDGGQSYTGMEFGKSFASKEDIQLWAAVEAVRQVERFIKGGGKFPEKPRPPTGNPATR